MAKTVSPLGTRCVPALVTRLIWLPVKAFRVSGRGQQLAVTGILEGKEGVTSTLMSCLPGCLIVAVSAGPWASFDKLTPGKCLNRKEIFTETLDFYDYEVTDSVNSQLW